MGGSRGAAGSPGTTPGSTQGAGILHAGRHCMAQICPGCTRTTPAPYTHTPCPCDLTLAGKSPCKACPLPACRPLWGCSDRDGSGLEGPWCWGVIATPGLKQLPGSRALKNQPLGPPLSALALVLKGLSRLLQGWEGAFRPERVKKYAFVGV